MYVFVWPIETEKKRKYESTHPQIAHIRKNIHIVAVKLLFVAYYADWFGNYLLIVGIAETDWYQFSSRSYWCVYGRDGVRLLAV